MVASNHYKKYKLIIWSVILFILIDLSVLAFSFYISYQISEDAVKINVAARQRSLSQRITKNLLELDIAYNKSRQYQSIILDIESSMQMFDDTLTAFDVGGAVVADERIVSINPITDSEGRQAIQKAKPMWAIYKNYTADVLEEFKGREYIHEDLVTIFFRESIMKDVVTYATRNNLALLEVMTDLTGAVGSVAAEKTKRLRAFQALAIVIAVVNFFFILFFSLKRIRKIDDELAVARAEIDVMLHTISEGIFLLDDRLTISDEYSKEMEVIFNKKNIKGVSLLKLLEEVCVNYNEQGITNFLLALFDSKKKLSVLLTVNPLREIVVNVAGKEKYIRFSYARVESEEGVDKVLVRVCDITEEVVHERLASEERSQQFKHLRLMSALMNSNADLLPAFFQRVFSVINAVKEQLGEYQSDNSLNYQASLVQLEELRKEANLLAFDKLSKLIERLSSCIGNLSENDAFSEISHSEALSALHALKDYAGTMCDFSANLLADNGKASSLVGAQSPGMTWLHLYELVNELSLRHHKEVDVLISGLSDHVLNEDVVRLINAVIMQIFYHSIVFSIELPEKRRTLQKKKVALLDVRLVKNKNNTYHLTIRNDGEGVDVEQVALMLNERGGNLQRTAGKLDNKRICSALLYSCDPAHEDFHSYNGEILFGNELVTRLKHRGVRSTMRNVMGEGTVFDFSFPIE